MHIKSFFFLRFSLRRFIHLKIHFFGSDTNEWLSYQTNVLEFKSGWKMLKMQFQLPEKWTELKKRRAIISPYSFLGDGTQGQAKHSDVMCADCYNQLDVLGRHRICHISAPVLIKETKPPLVLLNAIWLFLSHQPNNAAPNKTPSVHLDLDKKHPQ